MNTKLVNLFKSTRNFIGKHSPEILTGIGITGLLTTTVLAVKATPKALYLIENAKEDQNKDKLKPVEVIKIAWKPYIPAGLLAIASTSCIIGASSINYKRNTALATAYAISERTLVRYRDKVIDTLGERKEKEIKEKVAQEEVNQNKKQDNTVIITSKGNTLCMDSFSGRYFRSDIDSIKKAINKLNRELTYNQYVSLNELYGEIGLNDIKNGSILGWNLDSGLIEPEFSTCLADNDEPCVVIDYTVGPRYDFDKLM